MSETIRLSFDVDGVVVACPECDHAGRVRVREGRNTRAGDRDAPLICDGCGATFAEAVVREQRPSGKSQAKYEHLNAADVGL